MTNLNLKLENFIYNFGHNPLMTQKLCAVSYDA